MRVLFAASEITPFAKVGGIADVVGALPIALHALGVDVRVIIPRYEHLAGSPELRLIARDIPVVLHTTTYCSVYETTLPNSTIPVLLIENAEFLSAGSIYNEHGDLNPFFELSRFLYFSAAVVATLEHIGWKPGVIHCHDWHTGILPALLKRARHPARTVFTIHNIAHQGVWNQGEILSFLGIERTTAGTLALTDGRNNFNALQQGIITADCVNTVSPTYAKEILTPEYGSGMQDDLRAIGSRLSGIINGIDTTAFNPATDARLVARYSVESLNTKVLNKMALQKKCGLTVNQSAPLFGFVGRLADQKGIDLILESVPWLASEGAQLVLLGSGLPDIEHRVKDIAARYPETLHVSIGFDATLAQQIYAGCDFTLVPSRFEPCGLVQMISMRYGTPSIVRATGGLADTVPDLDLHPNTGLGFSFTEYSATALRVAIKRALLCYSTPARWKTLVTRCLAQDFSWTTSAHAYLALYEHTQTV